MIKKSTSILLLFLTLLQISCYSVRIINRDGIPEPDILNNSQDFYRGKKVVIIDTTINLKLTDGEFSVIEKCPAGGFYSLEYRVTLGNVLLSAITLGRKRKVNVIYTCTKE